MKKQKTFEEIREEINEQMEGIKHKIMVMSGKGGVGKTTVAINLAFALKLRNFDVGILDADIHGPNVPKMLGVDGERLRTIGDKIDPIRVSAGLGGELKVMSMSFLLDEDSPVIWRGPLKMSAIQQFLGEVEWGSLDYLIVDLPPGTGDEPLSIAQLISNVDGSIIVTTPQDVALMDVKRAVNFSKRLGIKVIGIIENMSEFKCPHCGKVISIFGNGGGEKFAREMRIEFLGRIPFDPRIVKDSDSGKPFILEDVNSNSSSAFNDIVRKIVEVIEK
ncbi:MAG: ATP-binding protein [Candidatus Altiarchaeales archaeon]|nr:MAG: ATP-binding protein [Candidatus Altiarchaeales archaeon]RLI93671.1 MAG: ATP-binding protein [Candidatus Altiarchaeales archaeon]RLI94409.1 MAG: ATP-binding protein [Candidatus Altiarchaeales archaeon]HDO81969.1 ATP-binding protein [Candidatus Altiarchaeales archaeon]HEX54618.1 ATP-binding protein [Candidatus Altiarchaeales archaeon]